MEFKIKKKMGRVIWLITHLDRPYYPLVHKIFEFLLKII